MINALTIDVEDYFMVSAFADTVCQKDWDSFECRVDGSTYRVLEVLADHGVRATFFVLGWVGERFPGLVREMHSAGHEVACHGYNHRLITSLSPEEFREDTKRAKGVLEDIIGTPVTGYRATSYSIVERTSWALDVLIEEGFRYDSSIFPIHHDRYGMPGAERFPHSIRRSGGCILEYPPTTVSLMKFNLPVAGGGYLRLMPLWLLKAALRRVNRGERQPAILYFHPWEIDTGQPRMNGRLLSRFRHYVNLKTTLPKVAALLREFRFGPLKEIPVEEFSRTDEARANRVKEGISA